MQRWPHPLSPYFGIKVFHVHIKTFELEQRWFISPLWRLQRHYIITCLSWSPLLCKRITQVWVCGTENGRPRKEGIGKVNDSGGTLPVVDLVQWGCENGNSVFYLLLSFCCHDQSSVAVQFKTHFPSKYEMCQHPFQVQLGLSLLAFKAQRIQHAAGLQNQLKAHLDRPKYSYCPRLAGSFEWPVGGDLISYQNMLEVMLKNETSTSDISSFLI